ncbi:hypothetical protein PDE_09005 [Penicillium oxalicum 114-2]|uniref:Uncharacterized protein n=1 Tax=Penicillium oxalicum (strain 114-2 / CGMCC 5302) TaxID=933388 RepID=S8B5A5_PENO1|nr:hypothetical protein PDE_09005 [Penicillium oxalicum 114-2]
MELWWLKVLCIQWEVRNTFQGDCVWTAAIARCSYQNDFVDGQPGEVSPVFQATKYGWIPLPSRASSAID